MSERSFTGSDPNEIERRFGIINLNGSPAPTPTPSELGWSPEHSPHHTEGEPEPDPDSDGSEATDESALDAHSSGPGQGANASREIHREWPRFGDVRYLLEVLLRLWIAVGAYLRQRRSNPAR